MSARLQTEWSEWGEQMLVPGVKPISLRERLTHLTAAPLMPRKNQKSMNIGLFDEDTRNQLELF
ncbi:MAG TPA: hypothetical protein VIJ62_01180 [Rhizomicrobium sp.]